MHAELPRFVAGCGDNATLVRSAANNYGFAAQFGPLEQFDGDEKRVHVDVQNRRNPRRRLLIDRAMNCAEASEFRHAPSLRSSPFLRHSVGAQSRSAARTRGMAARSLVTPTFVHAEASSKGWTASR